MGGGVGWLVAAGLARLIDLVGTEQQTDRQNPKIEIEGSKGSKGTIPNWRGLTSSGCPITYLLALPHHAHLLQADMIPAPPTHSLGALGGHKLPTHAQARVACEPGDGDSCISRSSGPPPFTYVRCELMLGKSGLVGWMMPSLPSE